ncbi:hypothetical protein I3760_14G052200 [Carya illinoinensis]|nr:hypothetical protein I3760_14G052200 [Carya illinoinensis]
MSFLFLVAFTLISAFPLSKYLSRPRTRSTLPGGSLGRRISKHGLVFKTSFLGSRTVVIIGQANNKFVLGADDDVVAAKQPLTLQTIGGKQSILELTGYRYRLVKGAMMKFLKPESLQKYIKEMDELAVEFMKELTFNIASNILFCIKDDYIREALFDNFSLAFKAILSFPVNFPSTVHWRGQRTRSRIVNKILPIMEKRKEEHSKGIRSHSSDVLSCIHDTSAILLSLMIWKLARDPEVYKKKKEGKEQKHLTRAETRYTWQVAQELMRMIPPVFGSFRKALKDTSYGGYDILKGSQVLWVACGTHMNKDIFDNPTKFDPSRFKNLAKPVPPYAYFARVKMLTIVHNLVTTYEWSQVNPEEVITREPMPYPSMGLPIKIKPIRHVAN